MEKINDYSYPALLKDVEDLLDHPEHFSLGQYEEVIKLKKDILNDIQKDLLDSRRKKINKLMNIPEQPRIISAEKRAKIDKVKLILKER